MTTTYRHQCYKCGRFVSRENADVCYIADLGVWEEGYPECPRGKGCNTEVSNETDEAQT